MTSPYADRPGRSFWRRAVATVPVHEIDFAERAPFALAPGDRIATAGSCFAQHIARHVPALGLDFFCTETGVDLPPETRSARQFGLFSARYGNIYTATQLLQLLEEAFGRRRPRDLAWRRQDGRWVDALRPRVEPDGFASGTEVEAARAVHLAAVRALVTRLDVLVFTLGLTEAWRRTSDDLAVPLAPGVVAGEEQRQRYAFVNYDLRATEHDLNMALTLLFEVNPRARVVLTVSPVPLIATYEERSVVTSTCYSKSVLRVAVEGAARQFEQVDYFPSYEIITSPATCGLYFDDDRREVRSSGVAHVMRAFRSRYLKTDATARVAIPGPYGSTICDEETIDRLRP